MNKLVLGAAIAMMATPVFAQTMTVEFKRDSGEVNEVIFTGEGTATSGGQAVTFTVEEEGKKMCFEAPEQPKTCVVYETVIAEPKVGDSARYSVEGTEIKGTATVTGATEA